MPEEKPSLHIDLDWKKQAQQEKRLLEEEEKQRAAEAAKRAAPPAPVAGSVTSAGATVGDPSEAAGGQARSARGGRTLPDASLQTLVSTVVTQAMVYMGEVPTSSGQTMVNLDMAKHQVDTLGVLEEKTRNNLSESEQTALDLALYEVRTRFINAAQQIINGAA